MVVDVEATYSIHVTLHTNSWVRSVKSRMTVVPYDVSNEKRHKMFVYNSGDVEVPSLSKSSRNTVYPLTAILDRMMTYQKTLVESEILGEMRNLSLSIISPKLKEQVAPLPPLPSLPFPSAL